MAMHKKKVAKHKVSSRKAEHHHMHGAEELHEVMGKKHHAAKHKGKKAPMHKKKHHHPHMEVEVEIEMGKHKKHKEHEMPKKPKKSMLKKKMHKVMDEFKHGKLHSGSKHGAEVTNPKQAVAIAYSEARRAKKKKK